MSKCPVHRKALRIFRDYCLLRSVICRCDRQPRDQVWVCTEFSSCDRTRGLYGRNNHWQKGQGSHRKGTVNPPLSIGQRALQKRQVGVGGEEPESKATMSRGSTREF